MQAAAAAAQQQQQQQHLAGLDPTSFAFNSLAGQLSPAAARATEAIEFIAEHLKCEDEYVQIREDWKYVAMTIDRLQLYLFSLGTTVGTLYIFLAAPHLFQLVDQDKLIEAQRNASVWVWSVKLKLLTVVRDIDWPRSGHQDDHERITIIWNQPEQVWENVFIDYQADRLEDQACKHQEYFGSDVTQ